MNGRIYDPLMGRFMSADPFIQAPFERYAAHAGVGCASSVAGGGQCGSGAAAAVLGKWVTNNTRDWGAGIAQGTAAAVAGGVGSVIAGGKFENGAKTAAFGYLFNQLQEKFRTTESQEVKHYTGRMRVSWTEFDWDDPSLVKTSLDFKDFAPKWISKIPGLEFKVEMTNQMGEILHEARIDRQWYRLTIVDQVIIDRVPANYEVGRTYRWESAPGKPDDLSRRQIQTCAFVICSNWRK